MPARERKKLGTIDRECDACGHPGLTVLRSRAVRQGRDRVNPLFRAGRKTYAVCPDCRTRYPAPGWTAAASAESGAARRPLVVLGWIAAVLLALVVLAEAVVLAVIASPVSVPLAVGVVVAVLVVVALVVWNARRGGRPARQAGGHRR